MTGKYLAQSQNQDHWLQKPKLRSLYNVTHHVVTTCGVFVTGCGGKGHDEGIRELIGDGGN